MRKSMQNNAQKWCSFCRICKNEKILEWCAKIVFAAGGFLAIPEPKRKFRYFRRIYSPKRETNKNNRLNS